MVLCAIAFLFQAQRWRLQPGSVNYGVELVNMFAPFMYRLLITCSGQVAGVAIASAIFQSLLDHELSKRITGHGATDVSMLRYVWDFSR